MFAFWEWEMRKARVMVALAAGAVVGSFAVARGQATYSIQPIGLFDPAHAPAAGGTFNAAESLNSAGQVAGYSYRYKGNTNEGYDTWVYSPTSNSAQVIGLPDPEHVQSSGYADNQPQVIDAQGDVAGWAARFTGTTNEGQDAWFYSQATGTTQLIGLTDAVHTGAGGYIDNGATAINDSGIVVGSAVRADDLGEDAWVFDPSTGITQNISLADAAHTETGGLVSNAPVAINSSGEIIGTADRYNGSASLGFDAWLYSSATHSTQIIGLTDSAHTQTGGWLMNSPMFINDAGQIAGTSARYNGASNIGQDTWLYSPSTGTTQIIGLTDAAHTQAFTNAITNSPTALSPWGLVAGYAYRYTSEIYEGRDAWLYNPSTNTTRLIGLTDSAHQQTSGFSYNIPTYITPGGLVIGSAERFSGNTAEGQDAWFYNSSSGQTVTIVGSVSPTGYAYSSISDLLDNGTAYGTYYDYTSGNNYLQDAFRWTPSGGFVDLGTLVAGGLSNAGWQNLSFASGQDTAGQILGVGTTGNGAHAVFIMTPTAVPEPAMLSLLPLAALALPRRSRRP